MKRIVNIRDTSEHNRSALGTLHDGTCESWQRVGFFYKCEGNLWKFFKKGNDIILFPLRGCFKEEYLQTLLMIDVLCRKI